MLLHRFQETVLTVPSLCTDRQFEAFTRPVINGKLEKKPTYHAPKLVTVFEEDVHLQNVLADIKVRNATISTHLLLLLLGKILPQD